MKQITKINPDPGQKEYPVNNLADDGTYIHSEIPYTEITINALRFIGDGPGMGAFYPNNGMTLSKIYIMEGKAGYPYYVTALHDPGYEDNFEYVPSTDGGKSVKINSLVPNIEINYYNPEFSEEDSSNQASSVSVKLTPFLLYRLYVEGVYDFEKYPVTVEHSGPLASMNSTGINISEVQGLEYHQDSGMLGLIYGLYP